MAEFAVIRHYHFDPKNGGEIDRQVREGFVPLIRKAKGFIRYYWLDTGKGEGVSFGVFRDKAGADESVRLAADFVREHLAKLMTSKPEVIEGPVVAHD
jgi:quinol monooxygenase YgiN